MMLIDAEKAYHGLAIRAHSQTAGRGQRGRSWQAVPGQSLLFSLITTPPFALPQQFLFAALSATAVASTVRQLAPGVKVHIKWPNDIIINDKKAGGILIENVIRGSQWAHAVIGLGLNVLQPSLPPDLPHATSLLITTGHQFSVSQVAALIRQAVLQALAHPPLPEAIMTAYNQYLYKAAEPQSFSQDGQSFSATVQSVTHSGQLLLHLPGGTQAFTHGQLNWLWPSPY